MLDFLPRPQYVPVMKYSEWVQVDIPKDYSTLYLQFRKVFIPKGFFFFFFFFLFRRVIIISSDKFYLEVLLFRKVFISKDYYYEIRNMSGTPWKWGTGKCVPEDPLFTLSLPLARPPF